MCMSKILTLTKFAKKVIREFRYWNLEKKSYTRVSMGQGELSYKESAFISQERCGRGAEGVMAPILFKVIGFSKVLMLRRKIFGLLLLVQIKVSHFIGKSLNLAIPTLQLPRRLWNQHTLKKNVFIIPEFVFV